MNPIGILQGRVAPADGRTLVQFPHGQWESEFALARESGFDAIELLVDTDVAAHPLFTSAGLQRTRALADVCKLAIPSICATSFMSRQFSLSTGAVEGLLLLEQLIATAAAVGAGRILIPFFEDNALNSAAAGEVVLRTLRQMAPRAEAVGVEIAVETALEPVDVLALVEGTNSTALSIYYDIGNATSLGRDVAEEVAALAPYIRAVHLKDRTHTGATVPLGRGAADFPRAFAALAAAGFSGPVILETPPPAAEPVAYLRSQSAVARRLIADSLQQETVH